MNSLHSTLEKKKKKKKAAKLSNEVVSLYSKFEYEGGLRSVDLAYSNKFRPSSFSCGLI